MFIVEAIVSLLVLVGAAFTLVGSIGLFRLQDAYSRLHGPTKATTLGVGGMLLASLVYFAFAADRGVSMHELLITVFLFMTAPVSAHLLAKAALHLKARSVAPVPEPGPERIGWTPPPGGAMAPMPDTAPDRPAPDQLAPVER